MLVWPSGEYVAGLRPGAGPVTPMRVTTPLERTGMHLVVMTKKPSHPDWIFKATSIQLKACYNNNNADIPQIDLVPVRSLSSVPHWFDKMQDSERDGYACYTTVEPGIQWPNSDMEISIAVELYEKCSKPDSYEEDWTSYGLPYIFRMPAVGLATTVPQNIRAPMPSSSSSTHIPIATASPTGTRSHSPSSSGSDDKLLSVASSGPLSADGSSTLATVSFTKDQIENDNGNPVYETPPAWDAMLVWPGGEYIAGLRPGAGPVTPMRVSAPLERTGMHLLVMTKKPSHPDWIFKPVRISVGAFYNDTDRPQIELVPVPSLSSVPHWFDETQDPEGDGYACYTTAEPGIQWPNSDMEIHITVDFYQSHVKRLVIEPSDPVRSPNWCLESYRLPYLFRVPAVGLVTTTPQNIRAPIPSSSSSTHSDPATDQNERALIC